MNSSNVLIINGSARTNKGHTAFVLTPFINGMKKAGAKVELLYSKKLKIRPCIGDFKCWGETIGECFIEDDMQRIYPKLRETDILVLAIPVYIPLPGMMQNFINRLCPLVEPLLEFKNGRTRAKFHDNVKISKIIGVITGGWWEIENLSVVLKILEEIALNTSTEFTGAILRPHAYALREETEKNKGILSALETMGEKLIREGKLDKEDLAYISQPLVNKEDYIKMWNKNYLEAKRKQKN
ncbi:MAG: flavodoxin family protein [Candidatus Hodarchaeota archaeon]